MPERRAPFALSVDAVRIRPYDAADHQAVRDLFVRVNEALAPPHLRPAFATYVARSLLQEIDRIPDYYAERRGGFWVVALPSADGGTERLVGMFGLERADAISAELRRMYVDPTMRRRGLAKQMLARAEIEALQLGCGRMLLSTSELQAAALRLYASSGFELLREEIATNDGGNKTVGAGLRRFHFTKRLGRP